MAHVTKETRSSNNFQQKLYYQAPGRRHNLVAPRVAEIKCLKLWEIAGK